MVSAHIQPRRALAAIDLLRFAAAMMVLVHHFFGRWRVRLEYGLGPTQPFEAMPSSPWFHSGWIGVEIFFVISGYVIAMSARGTSAAEFAWRRLLRLWPGALICSTITAAVLFVGGADPAAFAPRWLASAFLVPTSAQIDGVYWTLGIECAFYALVALLLWRGWWRPIPVALALSLWSLVYWFGAMAITGLPNLIFGDRLADLSLGRYGAFFALGILIEAAHRKDPAFRPYLCLPALLVAPLCITWHAATQRQDMPSSSLELQPHLLFLAGLAVIVAAPRIQRWISPGIARISVALGLATYPLYLLHQYVGGAMLLWLARQGVAPIVSVGPVTALMVGLSLWVALRAEPTVRDWLNRARAARSVGEPSPA